MMVMWQSARPVELPTIMCIRTCVFGEAVFSSSRFHLKPHRPLNQRRDNDGERPKVRSNCCF